MSSSATAISNTHPSQSGRALSFLFSELHADAILAIDAAFSRHLGPGGQIGGCMSAAAQDLREGDHARLLDCHWAANIRGYRQKAGESRGLENALSLASIRLAALCGGSRVLKRCLDSAPVGLASSNHPIVDFGGGRPPFAKDAT